MISGRLAICSGLLVAAVLLGGGGTPAPLSELALQLVSLAAIGAWIWMRPTAPASSDHFAWIAIGLFVLLFLVQLVPLPPGLWHQLPNRQPEIASLALVGRDQAWMPLTVSPPRTLASALSLVPPLILLFMVSRLATQERTQLLIVLAGLGLLTCIVGAVQLTGGDDSWARFYAYTHRGYLTGFQANRNATADVLLIAIVALALYARERRAWAGGVQGRVVVAAMLFLLASAVVLTGSRAGMALLAAVALVGLGVAAARRRRRLVTRRGLLFAVPAAVLLAGFGLALYGNTALGHGMARFGLKEEARAEIWPDTRYAIGQHWPTGAGSGTFVPVFIAAERLEAVDESRPNRAHDDYLEFVLEAGLVGIALMVLAFGAILYRLQSVIRQGGPRLSHAVFSGAALAILALHSIVDYPMRSLALACVAGLAIGLLINPPRSMAARSGANSVRVR